MINILRTLIIIFLLVLSIGSNVEASSEQVTIDGDHGKLAAVIQRPDDKTTYPMVIIMHGFTSYKEFDLLKDIADDLEKAGIGSIRFDFNGHGQSEGRFEDMTVPNEISDARKVYAYVKNLPETDSVSLVGHSQGGVVASMLAGEMGKGKVKSLVLLAPAGLLEAGAMVEGTFGIKFDIDKLPEVITLPSGIKLGKEYVKSAYELPIYETAKKYTGPVCIIQGKEDTVVPYAYSIKFDKEYENSELHLLDGYDHAFSKDMFGVAQMAADFIIKQNESFFGDLNLEDNSTWQITKLWLQTIGSYIRKIFTA